MTDNGLLPSDTCQPPTVFAPIAFESGGTSASGASTDWRQRAASTLLESTASRRAEAEPAAETLCRLADALDCTADYLLGRDCFDGLAPDVVVARESFEVFARKTPLAERDAGRLRRMISHARAPKTVAEWTSLYKLTTPPPSAQRTKGRKASAASHATGPPSSCRAKTGRVRLADRLSRSSSASGPSIPTSPDCPSTSQRSSAPRYREASPVGVRFSSFPCVISWTAHHRTRGFLLLRTVTWRVTAGELLSGRHGLARHRPAFSGGESRVRSHTATHRGRTVRIAWCSRANTKAG